MKHADIPVAKRSLFSWILSSNLKLQGLLFVIIVITVFARVLPLEMQKRIVNEAINLKKFDLLLRYCAIYLTAVLAASGLKFAINWIQTLIGQKTLTAMRQDLYRHILTLPIDFFRKTQAGMVVSSLITEIASAGDFVGAALAVPLTSLLTLLAFGGYLFWLNPLLAMLSLSIYPAVLLLVPYLQRQANRKNKERVDATREMANQIGDAVAGVHEIHAHGAYDIENLKFKHLSERLMKIRIIWNLYRFGVKITNNLFNNLSPFLIFIVGGYLAMQGRLGLGSLVAFLSAQEKLYEPWKELIDFYQAYQDASVRYRRTMEYFDESPEHALVPEGRRPYALEGTIEAQNLGMETADGIKLLENVSFSLQSGEHLALVGFSGSGKSTLALCICQLYKYTGGHLHIGGREISRLSKQDIVFNVGFVSQSPYIFSGSIEENLLYACRARQADAGGSADDHAPSLDDIIATLQQTGIFVDILRFGLNTILRQTKDAGLAPVIVRLREKFQKQYGDLLANTVEFFDPQRYHQHSSVAENLLFGTPNDPAFEPQQLCENPYFLKFLSTAELEGPLLTLGRELIQQTVDILGNLPADDAFFEQSPIEPHELPEYKRLALHFKKQLHPKSEKEQKQLLDVALRFVPAKHKMVSMSAVLRKLILQGRALFREMILKDDPNAFTFFRMNEYIHSQTILNNILFGKLRSSTTAAQEKINRNIIQLLIEEDLMEKITAIGMQFQVGSKGERLSGGQRQKIAVARVLLKSPMVLIMDEATSALDNKSQARIQNLLKNRWKGKNTLIAVVHRLDIIHDFDRIAVMKAGKIAEMGTYKELMKRKGLLYELVGKQ